MSAAAAGSLDFGCLSVALDGHPLELAYWRRPGSVDGGQTLVYLHGLGSTREDFLPATAAPGLEPHTLLAFDFPGSGRSAYPENAAFGLEELAVLASQAIDKLVEGPVTLVGHSLGGAVALLVAEVAPRRVRRLIDVEGNLVASDCFLVAGLTKLDRATFERGPFLDELDRRVGAEPRNGDRIWAEGYRRRVDRRAFYDYGRSLEERSASGELLERFLGLAVERAFVHGDANRDLPYLPRLRAAGIAVAEVPGSGHWPLWDNPTQFLQAVARLVASEPSAPRTFDLHAEARSVGEPWRNFELCRVDDHVVRASVLARDFHWHHHLTDEALIVVEGTLAVDLEERTEELGPGQGILIPAGVRHRTRGRPRVVNLAFEAGNVDARGLVADG